MGKAVASSRILCGLQFPVCWALCCLLGSDRLCDAVRLCEVLRGLYCLLGAVLPVDSCAACHALCCLLGAFLLVRLCQSLGLRLPMKASEAYDCS
ncbi:hypothetical protein NDU88_001905 [Pleurodeles waltl]|uniref:Uncharacterized protein n=1 Tax=Pleurodeles waltl TaxID=8319 RepID=A0AAV7LE76_PLEWA|nr:hypothetical protein NDU88_001905 [Pleurodeles waltl]